MNYVTSLFDTPLVEVNPYYIMKFDCRSINDILCLNVNLDGIDVSLMIAACNDCFIRVFDYQDLNMLTTLKGVFGAPLCLDSSNDHNLLVAGYEDDSFIVYGIKLGFLPLCRGIGHQSFVAQAKFDNYLMEFMLKA